MRLIVLGCSGSGPGPGSPASGYLVEAGGARLTLDLGNGTFGALQRHMDPWALDAVVFSHLHADHCSDFASLAVHRRYHPRPPYDASLSRLPVHAPGEAPDRFAAAYAPSAAERAGTDLSDVFTFHPLSSTRPATIGDATLSATPVEHPCESYALRVEQGGRALVYSGDTGPCDGLVTAARGADVLLCEASWPHTGAAVRGVHLSGRQAGEHAAAAGVARLLLTHVPSWCDPQELLAEAKGAFDGPVDLVHPDEAFDI